MKVKSLILAMAACAGLFTACSNEMDEVTGNGNGNETKADAYMSVSFTMPGTNQTRATGGENGDDNEEGTEAENKVTDVDLYLFEVDDDGKITTLGLKRHIEHGEITGSQNGSTYTTAPVQVTTGKYAVYVIVNQPQTGNDNINSIAIGTSLADFQSKVFSVAAKTGEYCTANKFLMTNANTIGADKGQGPNQYKDGIVEITDANKTTANAAKVTVAVERAAARIDFVVKNADNAYEVKNAKEEKIATVAIKSYKVINTRNSAWFLKRVSNGGDTNDLIVGGDEVANSGSNTNYVVENKFSLKTSLTDFGSTDYTANYSRRYNTYVAWKKVTETQVSDKQVLAYCMENTQLKEKQITGLTTTVIFRAKYTPEPTAIIGSYDASKNATFYRFTEGSTLYADPTEILKAKFNKDNTEDAYDAAIAAGFLGLSTDDWNKAEQAGKDKAAYVSETFNGLSQADYYRDKVEKFVNGYCYYTVMLRHSDNADPNTSGIMEFATVRNNIYKISISKISSLGNVNSGTPGPQDPSSPETGRPDEGDGGDNTNPEIPGETDTEDPEPETPITPIDPSNPDESLKTYLEAVININDWTLRTNDIEL